MHLTVIELLLALLDVLEPDAVLLIEPPESRGAESDLWESPMDQYTALLEREMSLGFQGILIQDIGEMLLHELRPPLRQHLTIIAPHIYA